MVIQLARVNRQTIPDSKNSFVNIVTLKYVFNIIENCRIINEDLRTILSKLIEA